MCVVCYLLIILFRAWCIPKTNSFELFVVVVVVAFNPLLEHTINVDICENGIYVKIDGTLSISMSWVENQW